MVHLRKTIDGYGAEPTAIGGARVEDHITVRLARDDLAEIDAIADELQLYGAPADAGPESSRAAVIHHLIGSYRRLEGSRC